MAVAVQGAPDGGRSVGAVHVEDGPGVKRSLRGVGRRPLREAVLGHGQRHPPSLQGPCTFQCASVVGGDGHTRLQPILTV